MPKRKPTVTKAKTKAKEPKKAHGRPLRYTAEIAVQICERLAEGATLRAICRDEGMPGETTVRRWALTDEQGFSAQYTRAREIGYHGMFDDIIEISDTPQSGVKTVRKATGVETTTGDMIEHRRLRVDSRKWALARALPKIYGDKLQVDATYHNDLSEISDAEIAQELLDRGASGRGDKAKRG